jgi:hypothetical protein
LNVPSNKRLISGSAAASTETVWRTTPKNRIANILLTEKNMRQLLFNNEKTRNFLGGI